MRKKNSDWLGLYISNCKLLNKSDRTTQNYRADIKQFINWYESVKNKNISRVSASDVANYQSFLKSGGLVSVRIPLIERLFRFFKKKKVVNTGKYRPPLSVNSRRRHLSSLKNFFDYLKQTHEDTQKKFLINPVKPKIHAVLVNDVDINHTKYLRPAEWESIHDKTWRTKERLALYLLYYGGLRLHELCNLKRDFFCEKSSTVTFPRKGGKVHALKLKRAGDIFDQLNYLFKNRSSKSTYLFTGLRNRPLSVRAMSSLIKKMINRADCSKGLTAHSFRKSCATNLYLNSKDLLYVRDYLGHSDASVTQTYIDKNALHEHHLSM